MNQRLENRLRLALARFRQDHALLREQLMTNISGQEPQPAPQGRLRRALHWVGESKMRRRLFGTTALAASLVLAALVWLPGPGSQAYAMNEVVDLLRSADVIHAEGYIFNPAIAKPGQARTRCPVVVWIDRRNFRERRTSSWYRTDGTGLQVFLEESVCDGEIIMHLSHTEKKVGYRRLNPFQGRLEAHRNLDAMLHQWFGGGDDLGFVNTGRVKLDGRELDLWRSELRMDESGGKARLEHWIVPGTMEVAALKYWLTAPGANDEWVLVLELSKIERNVPIPPATFETRPPPGYAETNKKEKAEVNELSTGGLCLDGLWLTKHAEFTLADGSLLLGWSSHDEKLLQSQAKLFAGLTFGGELPKLPIELYALSPNLPDDDRLLNGLHLTATVKTGRYYEWSLYVPDRVGGSQPRSSSYRTMYRVHPATRLMRASGQTSVGPGVHICNKDDFDALVLGAMAELSDTGKPPAGLTYQAVMELSRKERQEAAAASRPAADANPGS